jgi:integrase/recombinase XerD
MDRHAATRRLKHLVATAGIRMPRMHPHMLRHTYVTTMLDAGVSLRDVQIAARHADPRTTMRYDRARKNRPPPQLHPRCVHGLRNVAGLTTLPMSVRPVGSELRRKVSRARRMSNRPACVDHLDGAG